MLLKCNWRTHCVRWEDSMFTFLSIAFYLKVIDWSPIFRKMIVLKVFALIVSYMHCTQLIILPFFFNCKKSYYCKGPCSNQYVFTNAEKVITPCVWKCSLFKAYNILIIQLVRTNFYVGAYAISNYCLIFGF